MKTSRIACSIAALVCLAQLAPASTLFYGWGINVYKSDTSVLNSSNLTALLFCGWDRVLGVEADPIGGKVYWGVNRNVN